MKIEKFKQDIMDAIRIHGQVFVQELMQSVEDFLVEERTRARALVVKLLDDGKRECTMETLVDLTISGCIISKEDAKDNAQMRVEVNRLYKENAELKLKLSENIKGPFQPYNPNQPVYPGIGKLSDYPGPHVGQVMYASPLGIGGEGTTTICAGRACVTVDKVVPGTAQISV
jgi:hypothetical protein